MQKIKIVTDSTSDLAPSYLEKHNIHIVPLSINIDGKNYVDQVDISSSGVIDFLEQGADAKTSQPPIGAFIEAYEELGADGSEVISIHMSSNLSGTYQTAYQASQMTDSNVTVIDSKSISYGLGYQIEQIVSDIEKGRTVDEIVINNEQIRSKMRLFVVIEQLNQLIKGGRISKAKGFIGNVMKIKPVAELIDGSIQLAHNSRTQKSSLQYLTKEISKFLGTDKVQSFGISHAHAMDFVEKAREQFSKSFDFNDFDINVTSPVISTHTGPGAIGVVVLKS